jgi:hypothetical protein
MFYSLENSMKPAQNIFFLFLLSVSASAKVVETNALLGTENKAALLHIGPSDGQVHLRTLLKGSTPVKGQLTFQYRGRVDMLCGPVQGLEMCGFTFSALKETDYDNNLGVHLRYARGSVIKSPSTKIISSSDPSKFQAIVTDPDSLIRLRSQTFSTNGLSPAKQKLGGRADIVCETLSGYDDFCTIRIGFP